MELSQYYASLRSSIAIKNNIIRSLDFSNDIHFNLEQEICANPPPPHHILFLVRSGLVLSMLSPERKMGDTSRSTKCSQTCLFWLCHGRPNHKPIIHYYLPSPPTSTNIDLRWQGSCGNLFIKRNWCSQKTFYTANTNVDLLNLCHQ